MNIFCKIILLYCVAMNIAVFGTESQDLLSKDSSSRDSQNADNSTKEIESKVSKPTKTNGFYATYTEQYKWEYGSTFLGFLAKNNISEKTYYNLSPEDKELVADVKTDSDVFVVRDSLGNLVQAFLSLNADTQVHIFYDFAKEQYSLEIIPIISIQLEQKVVAQIQDGGGPSSALYGATQDPKLNQEFIAAYKMRQVVQKGDRIAAVYLRQYRLGKPIGAPDIKSIAVESNKKFQYLFGYKNRYYDLDGKEMANFFLITPVKYRRISSRFSSGRRHPVLGYVRPHYGVDYAAITGTPIYAAGEGRITFSGVKGGYGKVVEINHSGGIKTLYAHMSKIAKSSRVGTYVRQGTYIGNVGSTGLSTGPHLHFGVYKNNKPINPLGQIKTARSELSRKDKKAFSEFAKEAKEILDTFVKNATFNNNTFVIQKTLIHDDSLDEDSDEIEYSDTASDNTSQ